MTDDPLERHRMALRHPERFGAPGCTCDLAARQPGKPELRAGHDPDNAYVHSPHEDRIWSSGYAAGEAYQRRLPYSFTSEQMRAIRDAAVDWLDTNQYGTQLACERRLRAALVASPADGAGVDVDELRAALRKEMGWSDHEVTEFLTDHGLAALEGASDGKERR